MVLHWTEPERRGRRRSPHSAYAMQAVSTIRRVARSHRPRRAFIDGEERDCWWLRSTIPPVAGKEPSMEMHDHGHLEAVHNMALVGGHRVFLSHLPMFMSPHDAQVIVEAKFVRDGKNADALYFADHARNPSLSFYTVKPESFAIRELFQAEPARPLRTSFNATVFRGHLEKGGTTVDPLADIEVQVTRV